MNLTGRPERISDGGLVPHCVSVAMASILIKTLLYLGFFFFIAGPVSPQESQFGERELSDSRVSIYNEQNSVRMRNEHPVPVFAKVRVKEFEGADMPPTWEGVIPAMSDEIIFNVRPFNSRGGWNAVWGFSYQFGNPGSRPDESALNLPPVPKNEIFDLQKGTTQLRLITGKSFAVSSMRPGIVFSAARKGDQLGSTVHVYHDDDSWAIYSGVDPMTLSVRDGARVMAGDVLGMAIKHKYADSYSVTVGLAHLIEDGRTQSIRYSNIPIEFSDLGGKPLNVRIRESFFWGRGSDELSIDTSALCVVVFGTGPERYGVLQGALLASSPVMIKSVEALGRVSSVNFRLKTRERVPWQGIFAAGEQALDLSKSELKIFFDQIPGSAKAIDLSIKVVNASGADVTLPVSVAQFIRRSKPSKLYQVSIRGKGVSFVPTANPSLGLDDPRMWMDKHEVINTRKASDARSSRVLLSDYEGGCR